MKTALKIMAMMVATSFALATTAPVVAHAADSSAQKIAAKKKKKKKKKMVASAQVKSTSTVASNGASKPAKIQAGGARLADSQAPVSSLKKSKKNLSNDVVFDGSVVRGQYQIADGATSVVENEKSLTSLISPRHDFKDRMQAERSQQ